MMHLCTRTGLLAFLLLSGSCQQSPPAKQETATSTATDEWVGSGAQRLKIETYRSARLSPHPTLLVVLHGDAPFTRPGYQYALARQIARANPDVVAVGLLRPGYTDPKGHQSAGDRGEATADNYTPEVLDALAGAITRLRAQHHARQVVVAGHSGGAALTANLLGRAPGLIDAAVLAACPCDVAQFRKHMKRRVGGAIWDAPHRSVSPEQVLDRLRPTTRVALLVGAADSVTPPALSRAYYQQLRQRGIPATLLELPGLGHELFLSGAVKREIGQLLHAGAD